jgi:hypothetical protein
MEPWIPCTVLLHGEAHSARGHPSAQSPLLLGHTDSHCLLGLLGTALWEVEGGPGAYLLPGAASGQGQVMRNPFCSTEVSQDLVDFWVLRTCWDIQ